MNQAPDSHPPLKRFGRLGITIDNLGSKSANVSINQAPDSHLPFKWFGRLRIPYFQSTISKVNVLDVVQGRELCMFSFLECSMDNRWDTFFGFSVVFVKEFMGLSHAAVYHCLTSMNL